MKKCKFLLLLTVSVTLVGCHSKDKDSVEKKKVVFNYQETKHIEKISRFSFDVYNKVISKGDMKSFAISPLGYYLNLNMLHNSKELKLPIFSNSSMEELNDLSKKMIDKISYPEEGLENSIYNCCIFNTNIDQLDITSILSDWFYASTYKMNFENKENVENFLVNWINSKSKELQLETSPIVVNDSYRKILCNVFNFKGLWRVPFDKKETKKESFTSWDGSIKDVEIMRTGGAYFPCYEGEGVKIVEIGYGKTGQYIMSVVMTEDENLNYDDFRKLRLKEKFENLSLHFPKFSTGIQRVEFNPIAGDVECLQITKLDVDEDGLKATSVTTSVEIALQPMPVRDFVIDKSFHFIISEAESGVILFMGRYY